MKGTGLCLCLALAVALADGAAAQTAILQMRVVEGEGAVHTPGSRSAYPLTVEVTDETGKPVAGAAVSFHLPDHGSGGAFANGLATDVIITNTIGRATLHSLNLNRISGPFQIRIVVSKEQARAGMVSFQYIGEPKGGSSAGTSATFSNHHGRWIAVFLVAGAGAAAGILASRSNSPSSSTGAGPAAVPVPVVSISAPSIAVGKP